MIRGCKGFYEVFVVYEVDVECLHVKEGSLIEPFKFRNVGFILVTIGGNDFFKTHKVSSTDWPIKYVELVAIN